MNAFNKKEKVLENLDYEKIIRDFTEEKRFLDNEIIQNKKILDKAMLKNKDLLSDLERMELKIKKQRDDFIDLSDREQFFIKERRKKK